MSQPEPPFSYEDDPDLPGWKRWSLRDPARFNGVFGPLSVRVDGGTARIRMTPTLLHSNLSDHVHGGALLGFIDMALFAASRSFGALDAGVAVTLDLSTQFITGATLGTPIEAQVELLRETRRLIFLRGLVVQGEAVVASFSGTIRKP